MKIERLYIENFLAIKEANVTLADRGLLLLQGKNEDDPSAASNGSGKSSLVDAIAWALYGVTARGIAGDSVINRTAGKGTMVELRLSEEGKDGYYLITRHRKHKTGKNQLLVAYSEHVSMTPKDISKGTDKETQLLVESIIGCSLSVFQAAIYAGQEQMPDLPGMTDKQLKLLLEEAAGTEVLAEAYAEALRRKQTANEGLVLTRGRFETAVNSVKVLTEEVMAAEKDRDEFEAGRKARATAELVLMKGYEKEAVEFETALAAIPVAELEKERDAIKATLAGYTKAKTDVGTLQRAESRANAAVSSSITQLRMVEAAFEARKTKVLGIKHMVGVACTECGRPHTEDDVAALVEAQKAALKADAQAIATARENLAAAEREYASAQAVTNAALAALPDVSEQQARLGVIEDTLTLARQHSTAASNARIKALEKRELAKHRLVESNPHAATVARVTAKRDEAGTLVDTINADLTKEQGKVEVATAACDVFGPAGVRAHILDTITPFLNDRTRDYLTTLSDGNIGAVWTTLSTTAKGELREKFTIEVSNDKGADSFAGLSGGEKRKVRLSCAMALQDLVASRASKPISLFLADEIDDALDEAGLERLMAVLNEKAKERGTVLVISHNALEDWIPAVITVTKTGGQSTVAGAI